MARERAELVNRVLKRLGVLAAGQSPPAEDYQAVDDELPSIKADLSSRDVFSFSLSSVPDDAFMHIADFVAAKIAPDFGKTAADMGYPSFQEMTRAAERELRFIRRGTLVGETIRREYF